MTAHAQTLSLTPEHYTPVEWVERARRVMGGIDLDPASCAEANRVVRAESYYTAEVDGLAHGWAKRDLDFGPGGRRLVPSRVFVNPPGDRRGRLPKLFWEKAALEIERRRAEQMIWLAFNAAHLRTLQHTSGAWLLQQCEVFLPADRIRFTGDSPTKDSAFLYWGPHRLRFREVFGEAPGLCLAPPMGVTL